MPTATTQVTYDFSVTGPEKDLAVSQIISLLQPYKDKGVTSDSSSWIPEFSGFYPPRSGVYVSSRIWSDADDAQKFVDDINSWLAEHPTPYASQFTLTVS